MQGQMAAMLARLEELEKTRFQPDRGDDDGLAWNTAYSKWGGYWGPFIFP